MKENLDLRPKLEINKDYLINMVNLSPKLIDH